VEGLDTFEDRCSLASHGVLAFVLRPATPLPEHATVADGSEAGRESRHRDGLRFDVPRIDRFDRRDTEATVAVRDTQFVRHRSAHACNVGQACGNRSAAAGRRAQPQLPENVFQLGNPGLACLVSVSVFMDQSLDGSIR
jgi:hypothetical protein